MLRHDIRFAHKNYGRQGSEFVIEHPQLHIFRMLYSTPLVTFVAYLLNLSEWDESSLYIVFVILLCLFVIKLYRKVLTESVLFLTAMGVQIETRFLLGYCTTRFIDMANIKDIVILEAVNMHHIIFYLALLLQKKRETTNWSSSSLHSFMAKVVYSANPVRDCS